MRPDPPRSKPILITSAAGAIGSIGRDLTEMLLAKGHRVRALVDLKFTQNSRMSS